MIETLSQEDTSLYRQSLEGCSDDELRDREARLDFSHPLALQFHWEILMEGMRRKFAPETTE